MLPPPPPPAEKLQNFFGVFLQFYISVDIAAKAEQDKQEQLLSELEHLAFQDRAQEDDVFTSFAGATELTAELAQTFIKEVLVSSPTEIEIVWKFRDVFDMQGHDN